jgi:hypothetical protein
LDVQQNLKVNLNFLENIFLGFYFNILLLEQKLFKKSIMIVAIIFVEKTLNYNKIKTVVKVI